MKINNVTVLNWGGGGEWWDKVRDKPTEPLIRAKIDMTLSWDEYSELLEKDSAARDATVEGDGK